MKWLPEEDFEEFEPKLYILHSKHAFDSKRPLLILVGNLDVKAGHWTRPLEIEMSKMEDSIIPFVERSISEGYEVLILNPGMCSLRVSFPNNKRKLPLRVPIRDNSTELEHLRYMWRRFLSSMNLSRDFFFVAHSFGGQLTSQFVATLESELFKDRKPVQLRGIAFIDSSHALRSFWPEHVKNFISSHCVNWVCSPTSLGTSLPLRGGCPTFSGGTISQTQLVREVMDDIFRYFDYRLRQHRITNSISKVETSESDSH